MNKIAEPITFVPRTNDNLSDDSWLSDGEIMEIKKTSKFIEMFVDISNSQKVQKKNILCVKLLFVLGQQCFHERVRSHDVSKNSRAKVFKRRIEK